MTSFHFQVVVQPKKSVRPNSAASSIESNYSKYSFDDDGYSNEREFNGNSGDQPSQSKTTKSYDSNNNLPSSIARQRRRDSRTQSSIESSSQPTANSTNYEISQESVSAEIEKKKEG